VGSCAKSIAGGDNSTMRVLPYHLPLVATRGKGSRVWDVDGQEYIDMNMAYGPLIFGHRPQPIVHVGQPDVLPVVGLGPLEFEDRRIHAHAVVLDRPGPSIVESFDQFVAAGSR